MVRAYQQLVETLWTPMKKKEKKVKSNMKQATKLNYKLLKISEVKIDKLEEEDKEEHLFKTVLITNTMKHLNERRQRARENLYRAKSYETVTLPSSTTSPSSPSSTSPSSSPSPANPSSKPFPSAHFPKSDSTRKSLRRKCRQAAYEGLIYSKNALDKIKQKNKKGEGNE